MDATVADVVNIGLICLEVVATVALWVWLFFTLSKLRKQFGDTRPVITEVHDSDPNLDLRLGVKAFVVQASSILPVIAAFAALDAFFSNPIVSYFTLFPLLVSLISYYYVFASDATSFTLAAPRSEVIKHKNGADMIKMDKKSRKDLLSKFVKLYSFSIVGHLTFVVGVLAFIAGTIIDKNSSPSDKELIYTMLHITLISFINAFVTEVLFFNHQFKTRNLSDS